MVEVSFLDPVLYPSKGVPLFVEAPINPDLSPVLVSSTRGLLWVSDKKGRVRAAFRQQPSSVFNEIIRTAFHTGVENGWGNSSDLSPEGLRSGIQFFKYYDIPGDYLVLKSKTAPEIDLKGVTSVEVSWLKEDCMILIPEDRSYLGTVISHVENNKPSGFFSFVVHNLSRGMYILNYGMA